MLLLVRRGLTTQRYFAKPDYQAFWTLPPFRQRVQT